MVFTAQVSRAISSVSRNDLGSLESTVSLISGRNPWTKLRISSVSVIYKRRNLLVNLNMRPKVQSFLVGEW